MSEHIVTGRCLCKTVSYQINGNLGIFQYCHCSRCRMVTGSEHSANLLVSPDQFQWISGEEAVGRYEPAEAKHFANVVVQQCHG
jgi:hypothetical protein